MKTIEAIQFHSKKINFDFNFENTSDAWCDTRHMRVFWEAVSLITPSAEKYIMRSVLAYKNEEIIKGNSWLQTLVNEFIEQEREHTHIHIKLNKALGINDIGENSSLEKTMRGLTEDLSILDNLAIAAALEHLFFSVIKLTFIDTGFYKDQTVDKKVLEVFKWHWCEELEHHSVTISLLSNLDSSYKTRIRAAYNIVFKFIPDCWKIILELERLYSPKNYRFNAMIDTIKLLNYFRKGIGVSSKFFDPAYDVIPAGKWSWTYIEQWRKSFGVNEPVNIRSDKN
ncbi:metal-dependent hydrolase [Zhongshania sp. BJYM1]|jgi:predicted metal-dependent hydrolase|uniref:metal-dependent hydrolase n=1 Tax=Zhongshania aquatica TaxID=2965069 RepID=UPI0022B4A79C|nr:metal-dependent hydrolase [Marortus sp. BJYM1]